MADDFNRIMVHALAEYLRANVGGVAQVLEEWPTANVTLAYPAISIVTQSCLLVPATMRKEVVGAIANNHAPVTNYIGQHEFKLQIDLWERTKPQRSALVQAFLDAFNKDIVPAGLRLQLSSYSDQWSNMWMTSQEFGDTGRGSQIQEWRATIGVEGCCQAVRLTTDHIMETIELSGAEFSTGYVNAT